jgi:CheY-like chemotaxis protein
MGFREELPILVADDDERMQEMLRAMLAEFGLSNVVTVGSGLEALRRLENEDFELAICDHHMAPVTGLELLSELHEDERWAHLPFLLITADSDIAIVRAAAKAGVDVLIKPIRPDVLLERLTRLLGHERLRRTA